MKRRTRSELVFTLALLVFVVLIQGYQLRQKIECPFSVLVSTTDGTKMLSAWETEEGDYYVFLPGYVQLNDVQLVKTTDNTIHINDVVITDGMSCAGFRLNEAYVLSGTSWGSSFRKTVTFVRSANVPTMYIDTASGSMAYIHEKKGNEETGSLQLYSAAGELECSTQLESINGRGNYNWEHFEKKAYSITCSNEVDFLGMGHAKKWILLANAADTTHLRNKIVYEFADAVGLPYSPDSAWVDLYLNGEYVGLYLLCERNEIHSQRVDISPTNGFLVSLEPEDRLKDQNYLHIVTGEKHALRIHHPLDVSKEYIKELSERWQSFENALLAHDGCDPITELSWLDQIDLDSWVRKYLIEELFGNYDAGIISQFFYSDETNRIYAGPVWDYDNAIGLETSWQLQNAQSFFANRVKAREGMSIPWFYHLYNNDIFYSRMTELYELEFLPQMEALYSRIDEYEAYIFHASAMNGIRWTNQVDEAEGVQIDKIKTYLKERTIFLSQIWLEDTPYCLLRADNGFGVNYAYYVIAPGKHLDTIPTFDDTDTSRFIGWYYEDTNEPFDITKPITKDVEIYAKWEDRPEKKKQQLVKLVPLGIVSVFGMMLLVADIQRSGKRKS